MSDIGAIAGIILGLAFEWSGVAKVASRDAWQIEGTPFATSSTAVNRSIRSGLPWVELVLGGVLILGFVPAVAGAIAALLLVVFTAALVRVMRLGQRPACMCFGAVRPRPISWRTVCRNLVLIALAVTTIVAT